MIGAFSHNIKANYMDEVATCAGLVVGNGAIDYMLGKEQAFNDAIKVAYYANVPTMNGIGAMINFTAEERALADKIFSANIDKVINLSNSGNFDAALYEELVGCYRRLALVLISPTTAQYFSFDEGAKGRIDEKIEKTRKNLKRLLDAG